MNAQKKYIMDIDKYINAILIRNGKHCTVYSIQNKNTEKYYAAKVIKCEDDETQIQKIIDFLIGPLVRLQHFTIIKYYGYSLQDFDGKNNITLIMDLARNGSLSSYIERIRTPNNEIFYNNTSRQKILIGIVRGMIYLHSHGITNIDLTPRKILLDDYYLPKITDYGLFKLYRELNVSDNHKTDYNDLIYTAPEVFSDNSYNDKSDVYSFGIIMYELITESTAFPQFKNGEITESQFKDKVLEENYRPIFNSPIKPSLQNLIERCWSKDPKLRPTFEYLFKKLAYNSEDGEDEISTEDKNELDKYFLDNVDKDDLLSYVDVIIGNDTISIEKQQQKSPTSNKGGLTISRFNSLPIKSQQITISKILSNPSNIENGQFIKDLNNLLLFLLQMGIDSSDRYIEIPGPEDDDILNDDVNSIHLRSTATELLHSNKLLNSPEFLKNIKPFSLKMIQLKYPTETFSDVYEIVSEIKKNEIEDLQIEIFITGVRQTDETFTYKTNINSIILDSSVNTIGSNAFSGCLSLTHVEIPHSVKTIDKGAFLGCSSLKTINIPSSVTELGDRAFYECSSLTDIKIPNSVKTIGKAVFYMCRSLRSIRIPESITVIDDGTFIDCTSLSKVELPPNLTTIGECCFAKCSSLTAIEIPDTVTTIIKGAFYACTSIREFVIPPLVTEIGDHEFQECTALQKVVFSKSLKNIGICSFCRCTNLEQIQIPDSVESIGKGAFYCCYALKKVNLPYLVTTIELGTFQKCESLTEYEIPNTITEIGGSAFRDCSSLVKISIPSTVTEIGVGAFYNCESLSEISIPSTVSSIQLSTFQGCTALANIKIPSSVKEIGDRAFMGCSSLSKLNIPPSITTIGENAFIECDSLRKISIPSSVTLGKQAFSRRTKLIKC